MMLFNFLDKFKRHKEDNNEDYYFGSEQNNQGSKPKTPKIFKLLGFILLLVILFNIVTTIAYTVEETEQAVLTTFGKVTKVETAGLNFKLPYPIQDVKKLEVNKTQKMQIGYASSSGLEDLDALKTVAGESKMITGDFNIVNIDFFIEWKIADPINYLYNSDNPATILKMISQSSARGIIGSKEVDGVLTTEKSIIQAEIKEKIREKLEDYDLGIQVLDVKIQDSEPPTNEVKAAFKDVETAKQERETKINEALSYKNTELPKAQSDADKKIRDAEGFKQAKINEAKGDVAKFNAMYEEYAKNKGITRTRMYLETIEKVLPDVTVYVDSTEGGVSKMLPLKSFSNIQIDNSTSGGAN